MQAAQPRTSPRTRHKLTLATLRAIARRRSIVLGYHGVGKSAFADDLSRLLVDPAVFRLQLTLLVDAGFRFITVAELARSLDGPPPPGLAVITFDDGMRNNHSTALPIMRELGIPGTVYVTSDFIGARSPWIGAGADGEMLNEDEIRALAAAGWEIGGHTITHPDLSTLAYEACLHEVEGGKQILERKVGRAVETFAYPSGRYGPAALAAVKDAGLLAAVTTGSGRWDRYEVTRAMMSARDPAPITLLKLTDRYEPLLASPPMQLLRSAGKRRRGQIGQRHDGRHPQ